MRDLYGNEQKDTPTLTLLKSRERNAKVESDFHFKLGTRVYPDLSRAAVVEHLRKIAEVVEGTNAERFTLQVSVEEIKK